ALAPLPMVPQTLYTVVGDTDGVAPLKLRSADDCNLTNKYGAMADKRMAFAASSCPVVWMNSYYIPAMSGISYRYQHFSCPHSLHSAVWRFVNQSSSVETARLLTAMRESNWRGDKIDQQFFDSNTTGQSRKLCVGCLRVIVL